MYNEFISELYEAFSTVEKPKLNEMTPHRCLECDDVRDKLHEYDKKELPEKLLKYHGDALPLLSPKALRYYLPRYIEFGLNNQDENAFDNVLYHLAPDEIDEYYEERIKIFTPQEKETIVKYLHLRRTMEDAEFDEEHIQKAFQAWA